MEIQQKLESIKNLITEDEIETALDKLTDVYKAFNENSIEIDSLRGRLSGINRDRREHIISYPDFQLEVSRIRRSALELVYEFEHVVSSKMKKGNDAPLSSSKASFPHKRINEDPAKIHIEKPTEPARIDAQREPLEREPNEGYKKENEKDTVTSPQRGEASVLVDKVKRSIKEHIWIYVAAAALLLISLASMLIPGLTSSPPEVEIIETLGLHHGIFLTQEVEGTCEIPDFFNPPKKKTCVESSKAAISELQQFKEFSLKNNIYVNDPISEKRFMEMLNAESSLEDNPLIFSFCFEDSTDNKLVGFMFSISKTYCDRIQFGIKRSDWHRFQNFGDRDPVFLYRKKLTDRCIKFYVYK